MTDELTRLPCACVSSDAYTCWSDRYNLAGVSCSAVEFDGGPCLCSCHYEVTDDDDLEPWEREHQ